MTNIVLCYMCEIVHLQTPLFGPLGCTLITKWKLSAPSLGLILHNSFWICPQSSPGHTTTVYGKSQMWELQSILDLQLVGTNHFDIVCIKKKKKEGLGVSVESNTIVENNN